MIDTFILDPFYLYLTMNPPRDIGALAGRYDLPEADLRIRAEREAWGERARRFEHDVSGRDELVQRQVQLWLSILVILASQGPTSGVRVGSVAVGTNLLVQVQGDA